MMLDMPQRRRGLIADEVRGHGVGLCQEGTRDYASRGLTTREILRHYYGGARVEKVF